VIPVRIGSTIQQQEFTTMKHSLLSILVILSTACVAEVDSPAGTTGDGGSGGDEGTQEALSQDEVVTQVPGLPGLPVFNECQEHSDCDDQDYCSGMGLCTPEDTFNCEVNGEILDCTVDHGFEQAPPPEVMRCCDSGGYHECGAVFDCNVIGE